MTLSYIVPYCSFDVVQLFFSKLINFDARFIVKGSFLDAFLNISRQSDVAVEDELLLTYPLLCLLYF